jgi:hypothetical protein
MISDELRRHPDLVAAVLSLTHRLDGPIEQLKAEIQLADGSHLHVNEVYISGQLRRYAYYRLTPTGEVLQGWDNAPHHPEIASYPHHLHQQNGVHPSQVRSPADVLEQLEKLMQD